MRFQAQIGLAITATFAAVLAVAQAPARPPDPDRMKPTTKVSIHDPSTVVQWQGKYFVYGTGRGITVFASPDSVTWTRQPSVFTAIPDALHAAVPKNNGTDVWAPDIVHVHDQWNLYYAVSSWGSFVSAIGLATNSTLDPGDPAYKWVDRGVVVRSDGAEPLNAIDPGVILTPEGTLWLCYGSYHGTIQLIELDPKTGLRIAPRSPVSILASAAASEAADIIFHDGFYYLFVNHGSCCQGAKSTYTIRMGRSRKVTGPYVDRYGEPLTRSAGDVFLATRDHRIGPGHFGLLTEDGAERFSLHYEADLDNNGKSTLDLRPLLWSSDGWPVAGDHLADGAYRITSKQKGDELDQRADGLHLALAGAVDTERWKILAAGGGFSRIENAATGEALTADGKKLATSAFSGADAQLWRLEQMPDGAYRIRNKSGLAMGVKDGLPQLGTYAENDAMKWELETP